MGDEMSRRLAAATLKTRSLRAVTTRPLALPNLAIASPDNFKLLLQNIKRRTHFNQLLSHAIASGLFKDPSVSSNLLLCSLHRSHEFSFSRSLFFHIQSPNVFAYNFMLKAYSQSSTPLESITLYNSMLRDGVFPDNYTFPFVFKACSRLLLLDKGRELHCLSLKLGLELDVFVQNALVSMYSACGVVELARGVFDMIPGFVRDVVSWNSMISGYLRCERYENALLLFGELIGDDCLKFDEVTLISILTASGRLGLVDLGKKVHGLVMRNGFSLDVFLGSSLIDMYAKCGQMEDAREIFVEIPDRNLVCWTSMIVGYARLDMFKEATELFREMQLGDVMADATLVACVISACGHMGALGLGRWLHSYCERNSIDMNLSVNNALINMYTKCGDIEKALQIFNELVNRDVYSWTAMISGLAMNGKSGEALALFEQMELLTDVRPNDVTFLGVLSACSHGGFVEKGFHWFKTMCQIYHISPQIEHYGCMVDLLGRANLLVDAEKFIRAMPIQPDVVIWRSLLFACRSHRNIELAELAMHKIAELKPRRSEECVLLSNVYAAASMWDNVKRVRKSMDRQKMQKQPGCSFVEINGLVQEFFAEGGSHCQMESIYETNVQIHGVLQSKVVHSDDLNHWQECGSKMEHLLVSSCARTAVF